ncbi:MAG: hypothetical protein JSW00_07100 [Thermoplasmata archaeon]|nr:MAG: hypothetical protein JSW00_07100 [Thermoplasmata archaeon]
MIKFYYRKMISPALGEIKRPIADILIQTVYGKWIKFRPFIDSGADITIIPHSVGKYLGFVMEDKIVEFGGVSGKHLPVIIKKMKMRIGDIELEPRVGWALIEEAPPLLGRLDIFNKFNITFKEKDEIVILDPI